MKTAPNCPNIVFKILQIDNFNNYFTNIGADLASKISNTTSVIEQFIPASPVSSAAFLRTDRCELASIINSLTPSNSVGHDGIVTKVVQASCHIIATPLFCLINNSLHHGIFSTSLKIAKVVPIFKAGERNCLSNCRPISVLPCFSQIFEKVIYIIDLTHILKPLVFLPAINMVSRKNRQHI